jgi:hypothetical protein
MNIAKYNAGTIWPVILEAIANGQSLSSILRCEGAPSYAWAKLQLRDNSELRRQYDQAVEDRGDRLAEELIEIADQQMPEGLDGPAASAWVQQLRLKIDVRKWAASKLRPRVYGERIDVSMGYQGISIAKILREGEDRVINLRTIDAD